MTPFADMFNHDDDKNLKYAITDQTSGLTFTAIKDIKAGE